VAKCAQKAVSQTGVPLRASLRNCGTSLWQDSCNPSTLQRKPEAVLSSVVLPSSGVLPLLQRSLSQLYCTIVAVAAGDIRSVSAEGAKVKALCLIEGADVVEGKGTGAAIVR